MLPLKLVRAVFNMVKAFQRWGAQNKGNTKALTTGGRIVTGAQSGKSRVEIGPELIAKTWEHPDVQKGVEAKAKQVAATANSIIGKEKLDITAEVVSGVRPKGRPYANVIIEDGAKYEWGTSRTARYRILGRAAAEHRTKGKGPEE